MRVTIALFAFTLALFSCKKKNSDLPVNPPPPNPPTITPNADKYAGYYRVNEIYNDGTTPLNFTYLGLITKFDEMKITFLQYRRFPMTYWFNEPTFTLYGSGLDSLISPPGLWGVKILNDSTIYYWYAWEGCSGFGTVGQTWHKIKNIADTSLYLPPSNNIPSKITTFAGAFAYNCGFPSLGDGGLATHARLYYPTDVTADRQGNVYIVASGHNVIRKVTPDGKINLFAGNYSYGYSGNGGPAMNAQLAGPNGITTDDSGNVYVTDVGNRYIRKIDLNGIITNIAGTGVVGYSGDGGPATQAAIGSPIGITVDSQGNLYFADYLKHVVRKISTNGIITTVAGNGIQGFSGDGGPANAAKLSQPRDVTVDSQGNLFITEEGNNRIRKISNGIITTIAGSGWALFAGDGGPALQAGMDRPQHVAVDSIGNVYFSEYGSSRVRKISTNGTISTFAGTGFPYYYGIGPLVYSGDNGAANLAAMQHPLGIFYYSQKLYIADPDNGRIRVVSF